MPDIKVINNNIVGIFEENITTISTDSLETKILDVFTEEVPKPIIAKFPGITSVLIPEVQTGIVIENNKLTVTDQNITKFETKNILKFIQLVKAVETVINKPISSYGYNFIYDVENGNFSNLARQLQEKYYVESPSLPEGAVLEYALPYITFKKDIIKYSIRFNSVAKNSKSELFDRVRVEVNCHINNTTPTALPPITDLKNNYAGSEEYISSFILSLFERGE